MADATANLNQVPARPAVEIPSAATEEEFVLRNDPLPHRPQRFDNAERTQQKPLIEGLDWLAGQGDLF